MKRLQRQLPHWIWIVPVLGLWACVSIRPLPPAASVKALTAELSQRVASREELRVLFVGNSYSFGVPEAFQQVAAERGKRIQTGRSTFGGWTLAQHAGHAGTIAKLREGNWDLVVIQEHSLIPARPPKQREAAMFGPVRTLVEEARRHGAIPLLYQTWGRRDGNSQLRDDTFRAMNQRLREGYRMAAKQAGGVVIVPVGDAWEREMDAGRGRELYLEDGSHPSAAGDLVTAAAFYETIFR